MSEIVTDDKYFYHTKKMCLHNPYETEVGRNEEMNPLASYVTSLFVKREGEFRHL